MPARNRIKTYISDSYYHIYNRGVEKRGIFLDAQDYAVWQSYLKTYLLPKNSEELTRILTTESTTTIEKEKARRLMQLNNFSDTIRLNAYSFMPNHFHMLIHQSHAENMDQFMNSLGTRYTMYFNKKYKRVGPLFQGVYKAVHVESEEQLLYLTKYIHRNRSLYSSYALYGNGKRELWIDTQTICSMWRLNAATYKAFVEEQKDDERMYKTLQKDFVDY